MVLMQVTLRNIGDKPLFIKEIKADITTDQGESVDDAASAVDYARYLQAFPDLQPYATEPLKVETKILPGNEVEGKRYGCLPHHQRPVLCAKGLERDHFALRSECHRAARKRHAPPSK